jgi:hypothetical protein
MNILITLSIEYFLQNKLIKKRIFCLCFITYMGHLNLGNILFMLHHIYGTFKFREFGAAASNDDKSIVISHHSQHFEVLLICIPYFIILATFSVAPPWPIIKWAEYLKYTLQHPCTSKIITKR